MLLQGSCSVKKISTKSKPNSVNATVENNDDEYINQTGNQQLAELAVLLNYWNNRIHIAQQKISFNKNPKNNVIPIK
jgi:hypothetical protein